MNDEQVETMEAWYQDNVNTKFMGIIGGGIMLVSFLLALIKKKSTGEHFSQQGHKISDMKVTVIEKIFSSDPAIRKEREKFYIMKMNTKYKGLNKIS